jgi:hypothetical protein
VNEKLPEQDGFEFKIVVYDKSIDELAILTARSFRAGDRLIDSSTRASCFTRRSCREPVPTARKA